MTESFEAEFEIDTRLGLRIPWRELRFTFARSSGSGGQNVNKVNSKAILRWNLRDSRALPEGVYNRFLEKYGDKLSEAGEVIISADTHRDQPRNKAECLSRLSAMVRSVARPPKKRIATKPTKSSKRRRVAEKRHHSEIKGLRKRPARDD